MTISTGKINSLVSIAVCTYNGQSYLREQLDSLVNQSYPNKEIIVIDDCSTDSTVEILQEYQESYPFFKYFQNELNLGYVKNFEKAISYCKGDYIALSDQDDIWNLNKIELQLKNIGDYSLIYHDSLCIDSSGNSLEKISGLFNLYEGKEPFTFMFFNCISGHSILFRKDLIPDILPFNKEFFHDKWIAFVAAEKAGIKLINAPLVKYRQHNSSTTDLLKIKSPEKLDKFFSKASIEWIKACKHKSSSNKTYFDAVLSCFDEAYQITNRYKLFYLLLSKLDAVFYTVKKTKLSKLNYLRKICFSSKHA